MKSKLSRCAIAIAISTLSASAWSQQVSNLEIYGLVGLSYTNKNNQGATNGSLTELSTNSMNVSYLGFRGREDLGNGLSAVFRLESSMAPDTGVIGKPAAFFDRQSFVGLNSVEWGALTLGRQFHASTDRAIRSFDAFNLAPANAHVVPVALYGVNRYSGNDNRVSNAIKYRLDNRSGLQAGLSYGFGEVAGSSSKSASSSYDVAYTGSNYTVGAGWISFNGAAPQGTTTTLPKHEVLSLGGNIKFGPVTTYLAHYKSTLDSASTAGLKTQVNNISTLGASWQLDEKVLLRGAYTTDKGTDLNNVTGRNGKKNTTVLGVEYALSKRTSLNAIWANNTLSDGYMMETLYTAALGRNPTASSVQFYGIGVNHAF